MIREIVFNRAIVTQFLAISLTRSVDNDDYDVDDANVEQVIVKDRYATVEMISNTIVATPVKVPTGVKLERRRCAHSLLAVTPKYIVTLLVKHSGRGQSRKQDIADCRRPWIAFIICLVRRPMHMRVYSTVFIHLFI
ncbi:hypothetical protein T4D_8669 [Trichinella pseudospiralis]|uniref:Uncharacterized protein n=1 Tax=Trichinella pseudospiralis TaxID=6337 RepID=A0A0V1FMY9_TRIPS|nr:hypothetical protein T4D_8669 [Trichinella pseudospiralis]